eukprot:1157203-Pelagomonas_calceolata.AAC.5
MLSPYILTSLAPIVTDPCPGNASKCASMWGKTIDKGGPTGIFWVATSDVKERAKSTRRTKWPPEFPTRRTAQVLSSLLVCMVCDHPYHALYPLFALKNGGCIAVSTA